jgi:hypothetical protein
MHQIDISCVFCVRPNTVTVLCVRPVKNVHKCQYRLIITDQLKVTHQYSYSYGDIHLCICQYLYVFSVMIACRYRTRPTQPRSCNFKFKPTALCTLLCAHSLWRIFSTFYEAITLSANYLPPIPVCYFTVLFQSQSDVCPHEWRTGSGKWQTIVVRKMWMQSVQDWCIRVSLRCS